MRIMLNAPVTLETLALIIGAKIKTDSSLGLIQCITTDTRECELGDLFFDLASTKELSRRNVLESESLGAVAVSAITDLPCLYTPDVSIALLRLAAYYKSTLRELKHTVAITGSVGKTTTKNFLSALLKTKYRVHSTIGNFNNFIGLSLSVLSAPCDTEALVLELGMNREGEISEMSRAIKPTLAVITNIGTSHIGRLGDRAAIARAKAEITDGNAEGYTLYPAGEELLGEIIRGLTFSLDSPDADFHTENKACPTGENLTVYKTRDGCELLFPKALVGRHLHLDLLIAISASWLCGMSGEELGAALGSINMSQQRSRRISISDLTVIDDCYNASLESVKAMLDTLTDYPSPRSMLLGDILELGDSAYYIHRSLGLYAASLGLERLYAFGKYALFTAEGALQGGMSESGIFVNLDTERPDLTAEQIIEEHKAGEVVLFKASRKTGLERVIALLKKWEEENVC
nr:UDP-N-acetylmuramoyl-tripeptide--D-alanyl-D-alanine ligase [Clostridia bacterium]